MITITELKSLEEQEAAEALLKVFSSLQKLDKEGRLRVYARWAQLRLTLQSGTNWEREFRRVTDERI